MFYSRLITLIKIGNSRKNNIIAAIDRDIIRREVNLLVFEFQGLSRIRVCLANCAGNSFYLFYLIRSNYQSSEGPFVFDPGEGEKGVIKDNKRFRCDSGTHSPTALQQVSLQPLRSYYGLMLNQGVIKHN